MQILNCRRKSQSIARILIALVFTSFLSQSMPAASKTKIGAVSFGADSPGIWALDRNGSNTWDGTEIDRLYFWGSLQPGEIPVVGDWNGDGKMKMGIYLNGTWTLDYNGNGTWDGPFVDRVKSFGDASFKPVVGDWNGDGKTKIGVYNSETGVFLIDYDGNFLWEESTDKTAFWSARLRSGEIAVIGDWNGDGKSKIGIYAPETGNWYLDYNGTYAWEDPNGPNGDKVVYWSLPGVPSQQIPVVGDWNGSGTTKLGVYSDGTWWIDYNGNFLADTPPVDKMTFFGGPGWTAKVGDWNASGATKIAAYIDGTWAIDMDGNYDWNPSPTGDALTSFGGSNYLPVVGSWDGPDIGVTTTPQTVSMLGGATQQFAATISGTTNTAVTWSVAPTGAGTVNSSGLFTAATNFTNGQPITLIATSVADITKAGAAAVKIPIDFTINPPTSGQVLAGFTNYSTVLSITPINGFSAPLSLNWSNQAAWPPGVTASFLNNGTLISVTAAPSTPAGDYTLTFTAAGGGVMHTGSIRVTVIAQLTVSIRANPNPVISGNTVTLTAYPSGGSPPYIYNWYDSTGIGGPSTSFPIYYGSLGFVSKNIQISDLKGRSASFQINIPFATTREYSLNSPSVTIPAGQSSSVTETISSLYGFNDPISFSWSNQSTWPLGLSANFVQNPASGSTSVTINTTTNTPAGPFRLDFSGSGGSLAPHSASVFVTVTRTPDFSVFIPPPLSQTVGQGGSASYIVSVNGGFDSSVNLTVSAGLPTGITASFNPPFVSGTGAATLTIKAAANSQLVNSYPITVYGTRGALIHSTKVFLTVLAPAPAEMQTPGVTTPLASGEPAEFIWTSGAGASQYQLALGSAPGASNYFLRVLSSLSETPTLPVVSQAQPLYVTLSSMIAGTWQSRPYTYQMAPRAPWSECAPPGSSVTEAHYNIANDNQPASVGPFFAGYCDSSGTHPGGAFVTKCAVGTIVGAPSSPSAWAQGAGIPYSYNCTIAMPRTALTGDKALRAWVQTTELAPIPNGVHVYDATPVITDLAQYSPDDPMGTFRIVITGRNFGFYRGQLEFCTNSTGPCATTMEIQETEFLPGIADWSDERIETRLKPSSSALYDYYVGVRSIGAQGNGFLAQPSTTYPASQMRGRITINPGAPVIDTFEPQEVFPGDSGTLKINGRNLKVGSANPIVSLTSGTGLVLQNIQSATTTQIQIQYSAPFDLLPGVQKIKVHNDGGDGTGELSVSPRTYVVLVHGIGQTGGDMDSLGGRLRVRFAQTPGITINNGFTLFVGNGAGIAVSEQALASYVRPLVPAGNNIIFVGYSMGGLLSRQLMMDPAFTALYTINNGAPPPNITGLITLGTPNLGYPYLSDPDGWILPGLNSTQASQMNGDFRLRQGLSTADVVLSGFLFDMKGRWETFYDMSMREATPWLATSGRYCHNPLRLDVVHGGYANVGCSDFKPDSDGVVCEDSASWRLYQLRGQPTLRWDDLNGEFQHTAAHLGNSGFGVLCAGQQGVAELYNPSDVTELFARIYFFIQGRL